MSSSVERALQLPEVLDNIAHWIPLFEYDPFRDQAAVMKAYKPHYLLACTLVSRLWNTCFTPHLYHYCTDRLLALGPSNRHYPYERNSHHFRRLLYWPHGYTTNFPKNLVGLVPSLPDEHNGALLLINQGSRLRELSLTGHGLKVDRKYMDALMNLPCLEELGLRYWIVSNELLYKVLSSCAGTLKELELGGVAGFDDGLFNHIGTVTPPWSLPRLKSLKLLMEGIQSTSTPRLLRHCPALESIDIYISSKRHSISDFVSEIQEHCHNLQAIHLRTSSYTTRCDYIQDAKMHARLLKDCCASQGLTRATMVLPRAVDDLMKDALLFHADTLVMLDIECPIYLRKNSMGNVISDIENLRPLLERCRNLKQLRLSDFCYRVELMARLFTIPWGCQGLEQLIIEYRPTGKSITIPPERLEFESKAIRKDASPGKLQHHEYRNDGQGWFLKPGLDQERFLDALEDGDWKRSIFKHMFKTSGIRKAKYIRINQTEFFAREQFFSNMMAGRKEMVEEEPAVNVRNMPTGCGDTGRIGRGVASVMSTLRSIVTG